MRPTPEPIIRTGARSLPRGLMVSISGFARARIIPNVIVIPAVRALDVVSSRSWVLVEQDFLSRLSIALARSIAIGGSIGRI